MKYTIEIYKSKGQWRWRITAPNGKIIGASSEAYKARAKATKNFTAVTGIKIGNAPLPPKGNISRYIHSGDLKHVRFLTP